MVGSINKVILVGNVGKEPEIRTLPDGKEIASLIIATSESWNDKATGERKEKTEWHRVVVFVDGLINIIKNYVHKGSKLYVEGTLHTRKWQDSNGAERYSTEVVLQGFNCTLTILDSRRSNNNENHSSQSEYSSGSFNSSNQGASVKHELEDDLPF